MSSGISAFLACNKLFLKVKKRNLKKNLYNIKFCAGTFEGLIQPTLLSTSSDTMLSCSVLRGTYPGPAGVLEQRVLAGCSSTTCAGRIVSFSPCSFPVRTMR